MDSGDDFRGGVQGGKYLRRAWVRVGRDPSGGVLPMLALDMNECTLQFSMVFLTYINKFTEVPNFRHYQPLVFDDTFQMTIPFSIYGGDVLATWRVSCSSTERFL